MNYEAWRQEFRDSEIEYKVHQAVKSMDDWFRDAALRDVPVTFPYDQDGIHE